MCTHISAHTCMWIPSLAYTWYIACMLMGMAHMCTHVYVGNAPTCDFVYPTCIHILSMHKLCVYMHTHLHCFLQCTAVRGPGSSPNLARKCYSIAGRPLPPPLCLPSNPCLTWVVLAYAMWSPVAPGLCLLHSLAVKATHSGATPPGFQSRHGVLQLCIHSE